VAGANFGCGSSREAAVFALMAGGVYSVIAPSFGDIFFNNCFKNGLLPIRMVENKAAGLLSSLMDRPGARLVIDLGAETVFEAEGTAHGFEIDPFRKRCLMEGLDDIKLTLALEGNIAAFEARDQNNRGWAKPNR